MKMKRYDSLSGKMFMFGVVFLLMCCCMGTIFASSVKTSSLIQVKLLNQNPDPVNPGDVLEVRLGIENVGGENEQGFVAEVLESYPFELLEGEANVQDVGTILAYNSKDSLSVVKFKVKVGSNVKAGTYPLRIKTVSDSSRGEVTREVLIKIETDSNAEISSINTDSLVPGKKTEIVFGVKNVGKSELKNVEFSWDSKNDIILPVGSSNVKYIDSIGVGKTEFVKFYVVSDLNTLPSLYKLDLKLVYDDVESLQQITQAGTIKTESRKVVQSKAGIYVGGGTDLDVSFNEFSDGEAGFSIANIGSNTANAVSVSIVSDDNWDVLGASSQMIGNVKKGGFTSASFKIKPVSQERKDLSFLIEYTDTTGTRQRINKTMSLDGSLFNDVDVMVEKSNGAGSSKTVFFVIVVVLLVVGFVFYKKKKSRGKKNG
jgi:hypothetical protein